MVYLSGIKGGTTMGLFDRFRKKKIEKVESEQLEPVYEDVKKGINFLLLRSK